MFRADGGPGIGNGHIIRCLALAQQLNELGWSTMLAASKATFSAVPQAKQFDRMLILESNVDEVEPLAVATKGKADLLVIDHYTQNILFEESCRRWANKILVIDDLVNRRYDADYILNCSSQSFTPYEPLVPAHCHCMLGPKWALLRPEFYVERQAALTRRQRDTKVRRILIAVGGADGRNLTPLLISAAKSATAGLNVSLDVILGGHARSLNTVRGMQQEKPASFALYVDTDKVASLMGIADIAIGACGVSSWERCAMGLPTISIIAAENQKPAANFLSRAGAITLIGEQSETTKARIKSATVSLLNNQQMRLAMGVAASKVCDGGGVYRLGALLDGIDTKRDSHDI